MRILFASMPAEGHFLPMTGVAKRLVELGHDVRFYTGPSFADPLAKLGVGHVPFSRAIEINGLNLAEHFPGIEKLKGPKRIAFDVEKIFFANIPAQYEDIVGLHTQWPFEVLVHDGAFYAAYPVTKRLGIPAYGISPAPSPTAKSAGAPPPFFGLTPATNPVARAKHRVIATMVEGPTKKAKRILDDMLAAEGLPKYDGSVFELPWDTVTRMFQTGVPSMDFDNIHWPAHHQFVGPLLPPRNATVAALPFADRLAAARSVVVVSQGTVDNRDPEKLIVPTITSLVGSEHLVVATTGGLHTAALRARFPQDNVIIVDWVNYDALLPQADVFVGNGGYGSVMAAMMAGVPVVAAGRFEGKNDVNARLAYRKLAVDLKTERPKAASIADAVRLVTTDPVYRTNVAKVAAELKATTPVDTVVDAILSDSAARARG